MRRWALGVLLLAAWVAAGCSQGNRVHVVDPRADFLKMIDRPKVALSPEVQDRPQRQGVSEHHFTYASEAGQRVPGILVKAANATGRQPVVIAAHGTGGSKNDELAMLRQLAQRGFIGVAIDGRYHGERRTGTGTVEYEEAIVAAWKAPEPHAHPLYYDTVWDMLRLLDYLEMRPDVDGKRIGMYGVSKGGIETYFSAAVDERVAVAVPAIGMQSFQWALVNNKWQGRIATFQKAFDETVKEAGVEKPDAKYVKQFYSRVVPQIDNEFDGPSMIRMIAPRPLLIINSDNDPNTPLPGVEECAEAAKSAYAFRGVPDHFAFRLQANTAHQVRPESQAAAIEWFVKWLKPVTVVLAGTEPSR